MNPFRAWTRLFCIVVAITFVSAIPIPLTHADEPVFSGPQPGERITPFEVTDLRGPTAGSKRNPVSEFKGSACVLVFVHSVERSMAPLLGVIDQYASERRDSLQSAFVFLSDDRAASEKQLPLVGQSLRLQSAMGLSLDGAEGPGNYGLNKKCLMTVVVAKENQVTASFALVQPGIADARRIIEAMAKVSGDPQPPSPETLQSRRQPPAGGDAARPAMRANPAAGVPPPPPTDLSKLDLNTEAGLREAVKTLIVEVKALRSEITTQAARARTAVAPRQEPNPELPGATPTDPKLLSLLQSYIRLSNDNATVDRILGEVQDYIRGRPELVQQATNAWIRVIHLKYGTEYALRTGRAALDRMGK